MIDRITFAGHAKDITGRFIVAIVLILGVGTANAADEHLAEPLCNVLKRLVPEVSAYKPEGAQAQLVMAVAEAFDYDPDKLRQVKVEIDRVTTASCPKERESMLAILKMKSLAEAVR
jgi:hypothetical protein